MVSFVQLGIALVVVSTAYAQRPCRSVSFITSILEILIMNYDAGSPLNLSQNANCIDNCDFGFSSSSKWRKSQTRDAFKGEEKLEKKHHYFLQCLLWRYFYPLHAWNPWNHFNIAVDILHYLLFLQHISLWLLIHVFYFVGDIFYDLWCYTIIFKISFQWTPVRPLSPVSVDVVHSVVNPSIARYVKYASRSFAWAV